MTFISLLIVCSASWFIKNLTDGLYQWPKEQTDESRQEYIDEIAEDTTEYFTSGDLKDAETGESYYIYDGTSKEPVLTLTGAQALYGDLQGDRSNEDFLAEINGDERPYTVQWEAGLYYNITTDNGEIPTASEGGNHLHGIVAGTHYYRIIDNKTHSVIAYKHKVSIEQDTLTLESHIEPTTPLFVKDKMQYGAQWKGATSKKTFTINETTDVASFITNVLGGPSFGNSPTITGIKTLTPTDVSGMKNSNGELTATGELLKNNYSNYLSESYVHYTFPATAYACLKDGTPTYYGSIVQALEATDTVAEASAGTNVVALQSVSCSHTYVDANGTTHTNDYTYANGQKVDGVGYTHTINKNAVVGPNVTLIIPYDTTMSYFNASNNTYTFERTDGKLKSALENTAASNYIEIGANKILTNKGNIIIPGLISGGSATHAQNSITTGKHSRIVLDQNAQLKSTSGNITCYGYITEKSPNNGSQVEMTGGHIDMVFTLCEHRGGSAFSGLINVTKIEPTAAQAFVKTQEMQSSPFNRFYVESITTNLVLYEGATASGLGYMVVADNEVQQTVGFFGTSNTDFVQFDTNGTDNSRKTKVTFKYDTEKRQNQMNIEGNVKINPLKLEMAVAFEYGLTVTVTGNMNTATVYLPLSHYWNISFGRYSSVFEYSDTTAVVNVMAQDIKIMPGASVTVDEGVTLKAKNIAVYYGDTNIPTLGKFYYHAKSADDINFTYDRTNYEDYKYSYTFDDGEFIVNGTVDTTEAGGAIGGFVKSTSSTGKIISKSGNSVDSKEVSVDSAISPLGDGGSWTSNVLELKANAYVGATVQTNQALAENTWYCSTAYGDEFVWFDPNVTITYNLGYDDLIVEKTYTATGTTGIGAFEKFSRENFVHVGWFTDSTYSTEVKAEDIRSSMTLYAQWKPVPTYTITYVENYPAEAGFSDAKFSGGVTKAPEGPFTDVHNVCNWNTDTSIMYDRPYYFLGWSAENDGTVDESFTVSAENGLTLYAVWVKKVQLTINYNCATEGSGKNTVLGYIDDIVWVEHGKSYTFSKDVSVGDDNIKNKWYFDQWKDITGCTIAGTTVTVSRDTSVVEASINASWLPKQQVNITQTGTIQTWYVEYNSAQYTTTGNNYWLKPTDELTISATAQGSMFSGRTVKIAIGGEVVSSGEAGAFWGSKTITATYTPGSVTETITNIAISN